MPESFLSHNKQIYLPGLFLLSMTHLSVVLEKLVAIPVIGYVRVVTLRITSLWMLHPNLAES